jgi:tellurite resistance protein TerC
VRTVKRLMILVVGGTVLAIGIALIVLPGPAMLVIPSGLAILALEFPWARRMLRRARAFIEQTFKRKERMS